MEKEEYCVDSYILNSKRIEKTDVIKMLGNEDCYGREKFI